MNKKRIFITRSGECLFAGMKGLVNATELSQLDASSKRIYGYVNLVSRRHKNKYGQFTYNLFCKLKNKQKNKQTFVLFN